MSSDHAEACIMNIEDVDENTRGKKHSAPMLAMSCTQGRCTAFVVKSTIQDGTNRCRVGALLSLGKICSPFPVHNTCSSLRLIKIRISRPIFHNKKIFSEKETCWSFLVTVYDKGILFFYIHLKILWRIQNLLNQKIINHISFVLSAISQNVLYRFFSTGIRGFQKKVTFWFSCYIFICICIGFRLFSPPFISIIFFLSKIFIKNHPGFPISKTFRLINKEYYLHERTPNILLWNIEFSNDWKKVLFSFFNIHNLLVTLLQ